VSGEVALTGDAERALAEAQALCQRTNVAIVGPEHVLAGALLVLLQEGTIPGLPSREALEHAVLAAQGMSAEPLTAQVMFGSSARQAISFTAAGVRQRGDTDITAAAIAAGTIVSEEVGPMFFSSLGMSRSDLLGLFRAAFSAGANLPERTP
jgi:hypothetical protein